MPAIAALESNWKFLLVMPCAALVVLFLFDLDMALRAPMCASPSELSSWCLPLGWEGPFADSWSNRSRNNAIIGAAFNLGASTTVLAAFVAPLRLTDKVRQNWMLIVGIQIGLFAVLVLKSLLLDAS